MDVKRRRLNAVDGQRLLDAVLSLYRSLPKKGKPQGCEFTTLAAVVATIPEHEAVVLSLATGNKCLPQSWVSPQHLSDSHAEVLARRAAMEAVLTTVEESMDMADHQHPYLEWDYGKARLKEGVQLHLCVTEPPCGDAWVPGEIDNKETSNIPRTGAKCIEVIRPLAKKSDKILRWSFLGIQGKDLMQFLHHPLYLSTIIVCVTDQETRDRLKASMERAFVQRGEQLEKRLRPPYKWVAPVVRVLGPPPRDLQLRPDSHKNQRTNTCINWSVRINGSSHSKSERVSSMVRGGMHEVTLGNAGLRLGSPKFPERAFATDYEKNSRPGGDVIGPPITDPLVAVNPCTLRPDPGFCEAAFTKYFYNKKTRACETFIYGGCGGNLNRFDSLGECRKACSGQLPIDVPTPSVTPIPTPIDPVPIHPIDPLPHPPVCSHVRCIRNPCAGVKCPAYPNAKCVATNCGCGTPEFFIHGRKVNCNGAVILPVPSPSFFPLPVPPIKRCLERNDACSVQPYRAHSSLTIYPGPYPRPAQKCCPGLQCCACGPPVLHHPTKPTRGHSMTPRKPTPWHSRPYQYTCQRRCICPRG